MSTIFEGDDPGGEWSPGNDLGGYRHSPPDCPPQAAAVVAHENASDHPQAGLSLTDATQADLIRTLVEALRLGHDFALAEQANTAEKLKGYLPRHHAAAQRNVDTIAAAIASAESYLAGAHTIDLTSAAAEAVRNGSGAAARGPTDMDLILAAVEAKLRPDSRFHDDDVIALMRAARAWTPAPSGAVDVKKEN